MSKGNPFNHREEDACTMAGPLSAAHENHRIESSMAYAAFESSLWLVFTGLGRTTLYFINSTLILMGTCGDSTKKSPDISSNTSRYSFAQGQSTVD